MQLIGRALIFAAGVLTGTAGLYSYLRHEGAFTRVAFASTKAPVVDAALPVPRFADDDFHRLLGRDLALPVTDTYGKPFENSFSSPRAGRKSHEAIDLPAPRGTPVHAAGDGNIAKLAVTAKGGITIYEFDPQANYCYSYAHLDRYANHLREGMPVRHGDVIGYVGTTGDAPANGPHLHFAITRLGPEKNWWEGAPVNPYPILMAIRQNDTETTN